MSMLIEPPESFLDREYLDRLRKHFEVEDSIAEENCMSDPVPIAERVQLCGLDPKSSSFLDLGCARGYLPAAFGLHGCEAYGVDLRWRNIVAAEEIFSQLPL